MPYSAKDSIDFYNEEGIKGKKIIDDSEIRGNVDKDEKLYDSDDTDDYRWLDNPDYIDSDSDAYF